MSNTLQKRFTILGSGGFIGSNLVRYLKLQGHCVTALTREDLIGITDCDSDLGHVIYAIGMTGDFRWRPFDTVEAHVSILSKILCTSKFQSWTTLSSARIYGSITAPETAHEDAKFCVQPTGDDLYDLSKMLGEALCLALPQTAVRIVRLSNVYGVGQSEFTFLEQVISEICKRRYVEIQESQNSTKDYVSIDDTCSAIERISLHGRHRVYNVAGGRAISHISIAKKLQKLTGGVVEFTPGGVVRRLPPIDITRIEGEFGFKPKCLLNDLEGLIAAKMVALGHSDRLEI